MEYIFIRCAFYVDGGSTIVKRKLTTSCKGQQLDFLSKKPEQTDLYVGSQLKDYILLVLVLNTRITSNSFQVHFHMTRHLFHIASKSC